MKFILQTTDKYDNKLAINFFIFIGIIGVISILGNSIGILETPSNIPDWLRQLVIWSWLIIVVIFGLIVIKRGKKMMEVTSKYDKENH